MSFKTITPAAAILAGLPFLSIASAAIVDTGFEEATFGDTGLIDLASNNDPVLVAGQGANASTGLNFEGDGGAASSRVTIAPSTYFSMMGQYNGNTNGGDGAGLTFGWTIADDPFNPYFGDDGGVGLVQESNHVTVGITRAGDGLSTFVLAARLGGTGDLNPGNDAFGTAAVSLTSGNWYRLEGNVLFDAANKLFTFDNISVDDFGTGAAEVTANVLSGSSATITANDFGTDGRALYMTNRDRGFQFTDNYFAEAIPEPSTSALLALGVVGLVVRRRVS